MLGRAVVPTGGDIAADHRADRLGLLPADIALVGVRHERQPIGARLAPYPDTDSAIAHSRGGVTIGIGAAVDGVLNHPVDGGVVWPPPGCVAVALLHRKIQVMLMEPQQGLPCAAKFQRLVEHQLDRLLHAVVWIFLKAIAGFDEADWGTDHKFTAAGLLVTG